MKTKLFILSGFLGSGKTSLLLRLLQTVDADRSAVLVNDFGPLPVDAALLARKGTPQANLYEISGGSIFCVCKEAGFVDGLRELAQLDVDRIFIEPSGMSDPSGIQRMLAQGGLDGKLEVERIVGVLDAIRGWKLAEALEIVGDQLEVADIVCLTKTDLAADEDLRRTADLLRKHGAGDKVVTVTEEWDAASLLRSRSLRAAPLLARPGMTKQRPESLVLTGPAPGRDVSLDALLSALASLPCLLRVKGSIAWNGTRYRISDTGAGFAVEMIPTDSLSPGRHGEPFGLVLLCRNGTSEEVAQALRQWASIEVLSVPEPTCG